MSSPIELNNMDEATRVVAELQSKLSELDFKVWQYRKEMLDEFTRYAADVLKGVPKDVIETVQKTIRAGMKNYKTLNPDEAETLEAFKTGTSDLAKGSESATSTYFTTSAIQTTNVNSNSSMESPRSPPRSPHQREVEFQGVFTPSYLPLLDSSNRNERNPISPEQTSSPLYKGKGKEVESPKVDASTDTRSLAPSPSFESQRPPPKRRNTDEVSVVSAVSDHSDGPVRRSALRRSSSSHTGQSPRRVRFDFDGAEVLPSASPQETEFYSPSGAEAPTSYSSDEEEGELEQIENVDSPPLPRRISSSQRLRLLSSQPLEEGTQWTSVSAPPDGSPSVAGLSNTDNDSDADDLEFTNGIRSPSVNIPTPTLRAPYISQPDDADFEPATLSDDDMLDMPPLQRTQKSEIAKVSPPDDISNLDGEKSPPLSMRSPSRSAFGLESIQENHDPAEGEQRSEQEEFDELFSMDETIAQCSHERPDSPEIEVEVEADQAPYTSSNDLSRSPPISIPARGPPLPVDTPYTGIVGSYKGRPFSMPIVNEALHAQAASMGPVSSFVGSLDGRTGMDESDMHSFRQSLRTGVPGSFSGTPRSLSERMMMDDLREAEEGPARRS